MGLAYTWFQWISIFVIYTIMGWCLEVGYAAVDKGKFVNRGFLNGPVCPIYGFGGSIVIFFLYQYRENFLIVFFGAVVLSTILEFITGYVLEKIFHEHWWDYSDKPFNIKGYVCLEFSILWGVACTFVVDAIHPPVEKLVCFIPAKIQMISIAIIIVLFVADISVTVTTIVHWKHQVRVMVEIVELLRGFSDEVGDSLSSSVLKAMSKGTEWKDNFEQDERIINAKAELESKKEELDCIREKYAAMSKKKFLGHRRLENAFPKLSRFNPLSVRESWKEIKEKGMHYAKREN